MQTAISKAIRFGRATMLAVGLTVSLAIALGAATAALAAVPGDPFKLGQTNTINKLTALVGGVNGAMLKIDNNSGAADATALNLSVQPGRAPMKVDSGTKVSNLNSDKVDGKDATAFVPTRIYTLELPFQGSGGGQQTSRSAFCNPGDVLLSGGHSVDPGDNVILSNSFDSPTAGSGWTVVVEDNGSATQEFVEACCADFPPLR